MSYQQQQGKGQGNPNWLEDYNRFEDVLNTLYTEHGLKGTLPPDVLQFPSELNRWTVIVRAGIETSRGIFWGLGDANPENVQNKPHFIRMAETRALARAGRWATNGGVSLDVESSPSPLVHPSIAEARELLYAELARAPEENKRQARAFLRAQLRQGMTLAELPLETIEEAVQRFVFGVLPEPDAPAAPSAGHPRGRDAQTSLLGDAEPLASKEQLAELKKLARGLGVTNPAEGNPGLPAGQAELHLTRLRKQARDARPFASTA